MNWFISIIRLKNAVTIITLTLSAMIFFGFINVTVLIIGSTYISNTRQQADKYLRITDNLTADIKNTLTELNTYDKAICTDELLTRMKLAQYKSGYIKDIGFSINNELLCTTGLGRFKLKFKEPAPDFRTSSGLDIWLNTPIKLFNFEKTGHVAKKKHFNTVFNIDTLNNPGSDIYPVAIFIKTNKGELFRASGNKGLIPPEKLETRSWLTHEGIYSFVCSETSIPCVMSRISYIDVVKRESKMLIGSLFLSFISSFFIGLFLNHKLNSLLAFKNRFYRNMNSARILCHYQPIVCISTQKAIGCEVLCRYLDDDGHIVSPDKFLYLVKKKKLTKKFTAIIIDKTFQELEPLFSKGSTIKIAFNFFPSDFCMETIDMLLSRYKEQYPNVNLNLELTEDELVETQQLSTQINKMRKNGYKVSIDDFGTGYCSLSYLKDLNADYVKIDRSFIKNLEADTVKSRLVPNIVSIIKSIGSQMIAEGIENLNQLEYLKNLDVEFGQGYFFGKPQPAEKFIMYFNDNC